MYLDSCRIDLNLLDTIKRGSQMTATELPVRQHQRLSPRRLPNGRTPPGYRVLHVIVPEAVFIHTKIQAFQSGLRFPEYVAWSLTEAKPYQGSRLPTKDVTAQATEMVNAGQGQS